MTNKYLQTFQSRVNHQIDELKLKVKKTTLRIKGIINAYWFRSVMIGIVVWMFLIKDVSINLDLKAKQGGSFALQQIEKTTIIPGNELTPQNTSLLNKKGAEKAVKTSQTNQKDENLMNTYSNLPFDGENVNLSDSQRKRLEKIKKQKAYVKKYADMAKSEMKAYGIPASITLAQGLLESNAGESKLAKNNKNHFGLKCFSRKCKKGHCSNFTDDSHKDFFRKFKNPSESFHAHSKLLKNGTRYSGLFKLKKSDYKGWARGLRKAGYATDPKYDAKLIKLVEDLKLYKYDK